MSIERATPTRLKKEGRQYTVLPTDVIGLIQTGDALAIWCYLQSKPQDWVIRKSDLMKRLDIGRVRYMDAMRHLRDLGLIDYIANQGEAGKLAGRVLICVDSPRHTETSSSVKPRHTETEIDGSASVAETSHLHITDKNTYNGLLQRENERKNTAYHPSHRRESANHPIPLPDKTPADEFREYLDRKQMAAGE